MRYLSRTKTTSSSRTLAAVATVTSAVVILAGCSSSGPATTSTQHGTVTIRFLNAYNDVTETPVMNKTVIPRFEKLNPNIEVQDLTVPYDGMLQKFISAAAAGSPYDLMRSDIAWMPQLAAQGVLQETSGQPWAAPILKAALPGPLATTKYKGNSYGVPDDTNTQVLFWNKTDFKRAGLSGPPTTLSELFQDAKKLTIPSKSQHGLGVDSTDIWNVGPYVWSDGGSFTNTALTTASGHMNGSATENALGELVSLYKAGDIGSDFLGGKGALAGETGFESGQYAMLYDGPWAVTTYKTSKPQPSYGMAPLPAGPGGSTSVVGGEDLAIAKGGAHTAATIKFAKFLASPFAQVAMAKAGDMAAYKTDQAAEVSAVPSLKVFANQLLTAKARPVTSAYGALDSAFSAELQKVLSGKSSLSSAMDAATQQANSALAKASGN